MKKCLIVVCALGCFSFGFTQNKTSGLHKLEDGIYRIYDLENKGSRLAIENSRKNKFYNVDSFPAVGIDKMKNVKAETHEDRQVVTIEFTKWGTKLFGELTREMRGRRIGFIVEGKLIYAPTVVDEIVSGNVSMTGTKEEMDRVAEILKKRITKTE